MTLFQIITLALAILATIYQIIKLLQISVLYRRFVTFSIKPSWYLGMLTSVFFQMLCVWAFFGTK